MNGADLIILLILLVSAAISFVRGFFREVLSLGAWIVSVAISVKFTPNLASLLESSITVAPLRSGIAFVLLFVLSLFVLSMVNHLVSGFIRRTGFTGTDRSIGVVFGLVRGGVIIIVLVLVAQISTSLPREDWWKDSLLLAHFEEVGSWLKPALPLDVSRKVRFYGNL